MSNKITFTPEELALQIDDFAKKYLQPIIDKRQDELHEKMKGKTKRQKAKILEEFRNKYKARE